MRNKELQSSFNRLVAMKPEKEYTLDSFQPGKRRLFMLFNPQGEKLSDNLTAHDMCVFLDGVTRGISEQGWKPCE